MVFIVLMPAIVALMLGVVMLMRRNEERKTAAAKRETFDRIMRANQPGGIR